MEPSLLQCRIEELPFLGDFVRDYYVRDTADFVAFSPKYGPAHLTKYDAEMEKANKLVATSLLMAEQKKITERINAHYSTARDTVNSVERYAQLAGSALKTNVSDFGFKSIREAIQLKNDEGIVKNFKDLLKHIDLNKTELEAQGLTEVFRTNLKTFIATFETDSKNQTRKVGERIDTTEVNNAEYNVLWDMISDILKTGKTLYKQKNKSKLKDYTFASLIKKVHVKMKEEEGKKNGSGDAPKA
jgi:hypothetical protein